MASRKLSDLHPIMEQIAKRVVADMQAKGVNFLIYCTLRDAKEQAILYCQSRSKTDVLAKVEKLKIDGFPGVAFLLNTAIDYCISGPWATNAVPYESWHQYGFAWDGMPLINGVPVWDSNNIAWAIYGEVAFKNKLTWAGKWTTSREYPHVQFHEVNNPMKYYSKQELNALGVR
jgi:hypothetical protein